MTTFTHRADVSAAPPVGATRRRVPWGWVSLAAVAASGILGLLTWNAFAQSALGGVRVTYDAQPLVCDGAEVGVFPGYKPDAEFGEDFPDEVYFDEGFHYPAVELTPGMTCALRIQVVNAGWAEVSVSEVGLRFFGEQSGLHLTAVSVNPNGQERLHNPNLSDLDAHFRIDGGIGVPPGASQAFVAVFGYAGLGVDACSATMVNVPLVTFDAIGQTRTAEPAEDQKIAFTGALAACD